MQTTTIHNHAAFGPRVGLLMWGVVLSYAILSWVLT